MPVAPNDRADQSQELHPCSWLLALLTSTQLVGPRHNKNQALVHNMNFTMAMAEHKPGARPFGPHLCVTMSVKPSVCPLPEDSCLEILLLGFVDSCCVELLLDWATSSVLYSLVLNRLASGKKGTEDVQHGPLCHPCCPPHQARILSPPRSGAVTAAHVM